MTAAAVITGASSGLGEALALRLARRGVRVGLVARRGERLAAVASRIRSNGGNAEYAVADVADRAAVTAAIHKLAESLGPVDLLIACAGVGLPSYGASAENVGNVERMVGVNFLGVVYAVDAVLPAMLARGRGHVVGVSSLAAYKGLPGSAGYTATKAAVNNYLESLRIELAPRGVAVTCVCPGFVDTEMTKSNGHAMPMLLGPDEAARRIVNALARRPAVFNFPWPMRVLMGLSRWAPDWLVRRQFGGAQPGVPDPG